ncbi:heterokaryon incompatibility protein-domain-containing protein [Hypoxylon sp. FL0543]|nr:heterokaryon incompatibility protein-domain-containing protein [Hypoxylon sp. FL0543]
MGNFPYPPLPLGEDAIRILTVEPGDFDDQIICTLACVAFKAKPKYVALSYTWENPYPDRATLPDTGLPCQEGESATPRGQTLYGIEEPTPEDSAMDAIYGPGIITVNSHQFPVKPNLFLALRHLRSSTCPLALWVDAICINQNDVDERNTHVTLMSFIYKRAAAGVAWLGPKDYAERYPARSMQLKEMRTAWKKGAARQLANVLKDPGYTPECRLSNYVDSATLERSLYWTRLWVVQEICLPPKLFFAYGSALWSDKRLKEGLVPLWRIGITGPILDARESRYSKELTLEYLVQTFRGAACSDMRDRIYGFLGLAHGVIPYTTSREDAEYIEVTPEQPRGEASSNPQKHKGLLKVDYAQSLYEVWIEVVKYLHSRADSIGTRRVQKALSILQESTPGRIPPMGYLNIVRAARIIQEALGERESMITASGFLTGHVVAIGPRYDTLMQSCRSQQEWLYYLETHGSQANGDIEKLRRKNEQYMAKISNYNDRQLARIREIINPEVIAWIEDTTRVHGSDPQYIAKYNKIWEGAGDQLGERNICLCSENQLALVPAATRAGDVVIRFWDCKTAVVMRPYSKYACSFMLVGEADVSEDPTFEENGGRFPPGLWSMQRVCVDLDFSTLQLITAPM